MVFLLDFSQSFSPTVHTFYIQPWLYSRVPENLFPVLMAACNWSTLASKGWYHLWVLMIKQLREKKGEESEFVRLGCLFFYLVYFNLCHSSWEVCKYLCRHSAPLCVVFLRVCFCRDCGPPGRKGLLVCRCELGREQGTEQHIVLDILGELRLQSDPGPCRHRTVLSTVTSNPP